MTAGKWSKVKRKDSHDAESVPDMYNRQSSAASINAALRSLDAVAREAEQKWGIGKLEQLADPALAVRFEQARTRLNHALRSDDVADVVARCNDMIKGWKVLEKKAIEAGHKPDKTEAWFHVGDSGEKYAFVKDASDANLLEGYIVYCLSDIVRLLSANYKTVSEVKRLWPGSEVTKVKPIKKQKEIFDDDIPF